MEAETRQGLATGNSIRRRRWVAVLALVAVAAGLGWPLLSQLLDPSDPRDQPDDATPSFPTVEPVATPRNQGTRLEWAPGIQTWRHWYVGGSDEHLATLHRQGFGWVKQRFAWADLQPHAVEYWDDDEPLPINFEQPEVFLNGVERAGPGFKVLIQLDVPPEWALRTSARLPFDVGAWEAFVGAFASHFAGRVHAYEIGNEPNLASAWGAEPSPLAYAEMLAYAYAAIKTADPNALVVSAGLSPTGNDMPNAMDDLQYLRELYEVMVGRDVGGLMDSTDWIAYPPPGSTATPQLGPSEGFFDALGAHAPGFRAAPEVSPDEAAADPQLGGQPYFTFRRIEELRGVMEEAGDADKPVVVTEFGWTTDERPDSPYTWSAVSRAERADYTRRALQYAADHWAAWIGPLFLFTAPDPAWGPDHEAYWRAVTDNEGWLVEGLSLAGLGVVAQAPVDVASDVEEERAVRVDERVAPLPMVPAELPALGAGFAQVPEVRRVGGSIAAASRDGERLALAQGRYVVLMDVSDPVHPVELARSGPMAGIVGSVALRGDRIAATTRPRSDEPWRVAWVGVPAPGAAGNGALEQLGEVTLPAAPDGSVPITPAAPRLHFAEGAILVADAYCSAVITADGAGAESPADPPSPSDDCTLAVHRISGLDGDPQVQEVLNVPTHWRNFVAPALDDDAVFVAGGGGVVAYVPAQEGYQVAGEIAVDPVWMSVADGALTVLSRRDAADPNSLDSGAAIPSGTLFPATLHLADVTDPSRPVIVTSVPVDGNGGFRDGDVVGVIRPDCDVGACQVIYAWFSLEDAALPALGNSMLWSSYGDTEEPVAAMREYVITADGSGLAARSLGGEPDPLVGERGVGTAPHSVDRIAELPDGRAALASAGGVALVDLSTGLVDAALQIGSCSQAGRARAMDVAGIEFGVVVAGWEGGLIVLDADPSNPTGSGLSQVGCAELPYMDARRVAVKGVHAYVAGTSYGSGGVGVALAVVDATQKHQPEVVGAARDEAVEGADWTYPEVAAIALDGGRAYIATGVTAANSIHVFDVSAPANPRRVGRLPVPATAIVAGEGRLYVAVTCAPGSGNDSQGDDCVGGLRVYDTTAPGLPREAGTLGTTFEFHALAIAEDGLWAAGGGAIWRVDVSDPAHPMLVDGVPSSATSLAVFGSRVLAGEGAGGLTILDLAGAGAD